MFGGKPGRRSRPAFLAFSNECKIRTPPRGATMNDLAIFQEEAVCLTKFGQDSGQFACEILHRKEWERQSGKDEHEHEFWWGIGEPGIDRSINDVINVHNAKSVIFVAAKNKSVSYPPPQNILVWRQYQALGGSRNVIPKNILVTSSIPKSKSNYFALVCKSRKTILVCKGPDRRGFANSHYRYLTKSGDLGSYNRGQKTTSPLVRGRTGLITADECDSVIGCSAELAEPYCL